MKEVWVRSTNNNQHDHAVIHHLASFRDQQSRPRTTEQMTIVNEPPLGKEYWLPPTVLQNQSGILLDLSLSSSNRSEKKLLQEKLDAIFLESGEPYQGDLWELSDFAPLWMKGVSQNAFLCHG